MFSALGTLILLGFLVWLGRRVRAADAGLRALQARLQELEEEVARFRAEPEPARPPAPAPPARDVVSLTVPPWLGTPAEPAALEEKEAAAAEVPPDAGDLPRVLPEPSRPFSRALPAIDWEQFMGVKLFAWIGGLALFLGVAFFVKYSFEHDLVPPEVRVALGFLTGLGLVVGGVLTSAKRYVVTAQTLCATGVLILYAVTFACRSIYHFEFFGVVPTFLLMALITATAFLLAVRLDALVVAILGMVGGFLTPGLLSTGTDNPVGLFGYVALLDIGLIAVAFARPWRFLVALGALGTAATQVAWAAEFFTVPKVVTALGVFLGFAVLFVLASAWAERGGGADVWVSGSAAGMPFVGLAFAFYLLSFPALAARPGILLTLVFGADLCLLALAWMSRSLAPLHLGAGAAVFLLLSAWTLGHVSSDRLEWALGAYLFFGILHSVFPVVLSRLRPGAAPPAWAHLFPALALVLVMGLVFGFRADPLLVWPVVLLIDLVAIALAVVIASLLAIVGALVLTMVAVALWMVRTPPDIAVLPGTLLVIGGFAAFFLVAGIWATRRLRGPETEMGTPGAGARSASPAWLGLSAPVDVMAQVPTLSALLPFWLLILVTLRLPIADPSPVFGLALLLVALLLGLARAFRLDWLPAVGLACVLALEHVWHLHRFQPDRALVPLAWYVGFFVVFAAFPFTSRQAFAERVVPWAAAALSGPLHFFLVHQAVRTAYPNDYMGLLPAAFALVMLIGLVAVLRVLPPEHAVRRIQLAWFGGATLFFVTLIFPLQFDRQWLTLGWALEGTALLWLFQRVPHPGLRLVGVALLGVAFARLALNPAVLSYHRRSATPILNWYLYAYGVVSACLFAGARLLGAPALVLGGRRVAPVLAGLGTILVFLLMNIEIADYFAAGAFTLTFEFSGNLPRDMTYSVAWGLFALGLLVVGMRRAIAAARYASLGLLSVTLLKLFLHDLGRLGQLYRIGAFISVAVIAIVASFLYQRFLASGGRTPSGRRIGLILVVALASGEALAGPGVGEWQYRQELRVAAAGLVKVGLPVETLDRARPALEDLRVVDGGGGEVPYLIERPGPAGRRVREARSFQVSLTRTATVVTLETGLTEALDGVTVTTPATGFIKAVQIEGSRAQRSWTPIARGVPIFRQPGGASQLHLPIPAGVWPFLRLTLDDQRSPPVPVTGARVHAALAEAAPGEPLPVAIVDRTEGAGETRLVLDLGAAHLHLAELAIEASDPLFTRRVTLAARQVEDHVVRETALARGTIYRVAVEGRPASAQFGVALDLTTPARELSLLIHNDDSPPLGITSIRALRRPVHLLFVAPQAGTYGILTGNRRAPAPRYDVAALGVNLLGVPVARLPISPVAPNPDYRPVEVLPEIPTSGPALDVSEWGYRKRAELTGSGVHQLELDLEVLSRAQPGLADLRLMSDGRQVPYVLELAARTRAIVPQVASADDPKRPRLSRWALKLPRPSLPVTRLVSAPRTPLFRRELVLYEEVADERGEKRPRPLGRATWVQTPERGSAEFALALTAAPLTDTLVLETDNGDNPPIALENVRLLHPVTRLLFKAAPGAPVHLYYGNRSADAPRYDLRLVATQMLAAEKAQTSLGSEEALRAPSWGERVSLRGSAGLVFWLILGLVVVVLLVIITRLLPKAAAPPVE